MRDLSAYMAASASRRRSVIDSTGFHIAMPAAIPSLILLRSCQHRQRILTSDPLLNSDKARLGLLEVAVHHTPHNEFIAYPASDNVKRAKRRPKFAIELPQKVITRQVTRVSLIFLKPLRSK